jgi:hypothetical protein
VVRRGRASGGGGGGKPMSVQDGSAWKNGGYAHFPGTYAGDADRGLTCFGCDHLRAAPGETINERMHAGHCAEATRRAGRPCGPILVAAPACKYWERRQ